jgi:poly(beta-D-mannuronate) lyase
VVRIAGRVLILAILPWVAACAERDAASPPIVLAAATASGGAADPGDAAPRVRHPGRVLFDAEARRARLRRLPLGGREALCGKPERRWPSHGVVRTVTPRDDGGPDERSEPFALTVMRAAAVAYGLEDAAARRALVRLLDRWARGGGLARFDPEEANSYYAVDRSLLPVIVAWSLVRDAPEATETEAGRRVDRWLRRIARLRGDLRPPRQPEDDTSRNNHYYLSASVSMAWGALAGEDAYFREGLAAFDEALRDMRADGSLPLETERGARALWYQRHAIASLVAIAELAAAQGRDLYARERGGRSLHTAVRFLLDAIERPALVWPYAEANRKPGDAGPDHLEQDLGFLARRGHGRHYMAWAEPYMARFPGREESRRLLALLREADPDFRPMLDDYSGGNTTCFFAAPSDANGAAEGPAAPPTSNGSGSRDQRE